MTGVGIAGWAKTISVWKHSKPRLHRSKYSHRLRPVPRPKSYDGALCMVFARPGRLPVSIVSDNLKDFLLPQFQILFCGFFLKIVLIASDVYRCLVFIGCDRENNASAPICRGKQ